MLLATETIGHFRAGRGHTGTEVQHARGAWIVVLALLCLLANEPKGWGQCLPSWLSRFVQFQKHACGRVIEFHGRRVVFCGWACYFLWVYGLQDVIFHMVWACRVGVS